MPDIITPSALWADFDDGLELSSVLLESRTENGIRTEHVSFLGRDTGKGRVKIFGIFACDEKSPSQSVVIVFNDSVSGLDSDLSEFLVRKGYSVLSVDYRGECGGQTLCTVYPENVDYANTARCGRRMDYVDETADKTSWYEWVAVGIYARKYAAERTGSDDIALLGIRDGGEIVWKLAAVRPFGCAVTVCAAGWRAYRGINKFRLEECELDDERYRFIGGIDSQAYAPFVTCPVLMLCSAFDSRFDYDRAYDTFSRINRDVAADSVISYSINSRQIIDKAGMNDMLMFLDKYLRHRQVFIPQPVELEVSADSSFNLIATAECDDEGVVEELKAYFAEDCYESSLREWRECPSSELGEKDTEFLLNIYEKTGVVFAICSARYNNGFTVWSKLVVKKISGTFKNSQPRSRVIASVAEGGFVSAEASGRTIGRVLLSDGFSAPQTVEKEKGIKGVYSESGLTTYRANSPRYCADGGNLLKCDIFCDETGELTLSVSDLKSGEEYSSVQTVVGGVWQSVVLESKLFKSAGGVPLQSFAGNLKIDILCKKPFAVNNLMWL